MTEIQQLPLKFNNLFLIGYNHRVHREHREVVRKMRDLVRFLRKYTLIFLSVLSVFSVVKSQRKLQVKNVVYDGNCKFLTCTEHRLPGFSRKTNPVIHPLFLNSDRTE
jgi:hypothetical protein